MRSLNTSLPRSPRRRSAQPPEQLLQAFRTAALSVTNLYKTAASDQTRARRDGYQDALDDILAFLDKENLGLGDGEGWKVRRWATERLDGSPPVAAGSESDDDRGDTEKRARSSSPNAQPKTNHDVLQAQPSLVPTSPERTTSAPPAPTTVSLFQQPQNPNPPAPEIFSFRSSHGYPQDIDMQSLDSTGTQQITSETQPSSTIPTPTVRVEVIPRGSRTPHRNSNQSNRHNTRAATAMTRRSLGSGAGTKRRVDFNEYFDLGNFGDNRDGSGGAGDGRGGKRGRLT